MQTHKDERLHLHAFCTRDLIRPHKVCLPTNPICRVNTSAIILLRLFGHFLPAIFAKPRGKHVFGEGLLPSIGDLLRAQTQIRKISARPYLTDGKHLLGNFENSVQQESCSKHAGHIRREFPAPKQRCAQLLRTSSERSACNKFSDKLLRPTEFRPTPI